MTPKFDPKRVQDGTWERLQALAARNGISVRTIYSFVHDGLKVARPAGGRAIYSRQEWLDEYLESKVQS